MYYAIVFYLAIKRECPVVEMLMECVELEEYKSIKVEWEFYLFCVANFFGRWNLGIVGLWILLEV